MQMSVYQATLTRITFTLENYFSYYKLLFLLIIAIVLNAQSS